MAHTVVKLEKITKSLGEIPLLTDVDLHIERAERIGVVGANGAGKTTLLNIITGKDQPDSGIVRRGKQTFYYLSQSRNEIDHSLSSRMTEEFLNLSKRLGVSESLFHDKLGNGLDSLSGGERTKIALAMAFSSHAELLALDEPTNHLDANGIGWLISEANRYPGTLLVVSHDRFFLNEVVTKIVEVGAERVQVYHGNYSFYLSEREHHRRTQVHEYEMKQKEQARLEQRIEQLKEWAGKSHQQAGKQGTLSERRQLGYKQYHRAKAKKLAQRAKSQVNRLEKLREDVEKPTPEKLVHFRVGSATRHGNTLLEARRLSMQYGQRVLFRDSDFYVKQGDRIGVYGPNGCGKTTLLKMICGELSPSAGDLWVSPSMQVAYLTQTDQSSVTDTIGERAEKVPWDARAGFLTTLANMGFTERHIRTPLMDLSLGEQTRLRLAELVSRGHNLLLMDEPTNHLDIVSREELEKALRSYDGTMILVTHDRYLMENICDTLLVFKDSRIQRVDAGLARYLSSQGAPSDSKLAEKIMVVEARIAKLMGDISYCSPGTDVYMSLDSELATLLAERNRLRKVKQR